MPMLLMRLAGPMQSWGTQSRFSYRDTGLEPSKSGVVGLLCAALGRPRSEPVDDLAALRMGVRVDREGLVRTDYQTAGGVHGRGRSYGVAKASGGAGETVVSYRHYLADADFLVGLEGDDLDLLRDLDAALRSPRWQIFLGRKGYVPGQPVWLMDGMRTDTRLEEALEAYPLDAPPGRAGARLPTEFRLVLENTAAVRGDVRLDQPLGAAFQTRRFGPRVVETQLISSDRIPRRTPAAREDLDDVSLPASA